MLTLSEAKKVFKTSVDRVETNYTYTSVTLKETNTWFGYIVEIVDEENNRTAQFVGQSWLYNQIGETGELEMKYPIRSDQYDIRDVDYLALELQSAINQALLDGLHYFHQTRAFQYPNYSPITFK